MFAIQVRQDATSRGFGMYVGRFSKIMKSRQWMLEWGIEWGGMQASASHKLRANSCYKLLEEVC